MSRISEYDRHISSTGRAENKFGFYHLVDHYHITMAASDINSELLGVSIIVGNSYNIATKSTISSKPIKDVRNAAIRRTT